jgi:hypothetical protein
VIRNELEVRCHPCHGSHPRTHPYFGVEGRDGVIEHLIMDCCVWISWAFIMANPLTRMDVEMSKATLYEETSNADYAKALRDFYDFKRIALRAHQKGKLPPGFLDWTRRIRTKGPLEQRLIALYRNLDNTEVRNRNDIAK